jgi:peptidoglycan hydrolase-like protein with peptidoglycan-binding domain
MVLRLLILPLVCSVTIATAASPPRDRHLEGDAINAVRLDLNTGETRALVIKSEVVLDRLGYSPGVIDGRDGDNFRKAIAEFHARHQIESTGKLDRETFERPTIPSGWFGSSSPRPLTGYMAPRRQRISVRPSPMGASGSRTGMRWLSPQW